MNAEEYVSQEIQEIQEDVIKAKDNPYVARLMYQPVSIEEFPRIAPENADNPRLQRAIDSGNGAILILLAAKEYTFAGSVNVGSKVHIKGAGKQLTKITQTTAAPTFIVNGTSSAGRYYWQISDLEIDGNNVGTDGIQLNYAREGFISHVYISNCQKGLTGLQAWSNGVSFSEITHNSVNNVELVDACNDFTFVDCQLDGAGTTGLRIIGTTLDSQNVNLYGCVIQSCGKHGIHTDFVRAFTVNGCYFEGNNATNTGGNDIRIEKGYGVTITSPIFWGVQNSSAIYLDNVNGLVLGGHYFNDTGSMQYSITTTANTLSVHMLAGFLGKPLNDVGKAIVDFKAPVFKGNGGVQNNYAQWVLETLDATKPPSYYLKVNGVIKGALALGSNGDLYIQHYNANTSTFETVIRMNSGNDIDFNGKKATNFVIESGTTGNRPASPKLRQMYLDTTLNKLICHDGTNWRDMLGTVV